MSAESSRWSTRCTPVLPGKTYLLTHRCSERRFFLRPDATVTAVVRYALAVAAASYGVEVHGVVVMSNHLHLVVTDVRGVLPKFMAWFGGVLARALNRYRGRRGAFWERRSYTRVEALDREAALRQLVYVLANPVRAALVRSGAQWPGVWSHPARIAAAAYVCRRPGVFFTEEMPEVAELRLAPLPGFEELTDEEFRERVRERLEEEEAAARRLRKAEGKGFVGRRGVWRVDPFSSPETPDEPRRPLREVAASDPQLQRAGETRYAEFRREYERALEAYLAGERGVVFPPGTYKLRLEFGVLTAELPPPTSSTS